MQILKNTAAEMISAAASELFAPAVLSADEVRAMLEYPPDGAMGDLALPCFDRQFKKALKDEKLDIVHIHSPFTIGKQGINYAKKKLLQVTGR